MGESESCLKITKLLFENNETVWSQQQKDIDQSRKSLPILIPTLCQVFNNFGNFSYVKFIAAHGGLFILNENKEIFTGLLENVLAAASIFIVKKKKETLKTRTFVEHPLRQERGTLS